MTLEFTENKIIKSKDGLDLLFPHKKTLTIARVFIKYLDSLGCQITKYKLSQFSHNLHDGIYPDPENKDIKVSYSRVNFYRSIIRKLLDMGFLTIGKRWDSRLKRSVEVYQVVFQDIPRRPPSQGFYRLSYYLSKKWNNNFKGN
jgi:hypothetical protein